MRSVIGYRVGGGEDWNSAPATRSGDGEVLVQWDPFPQEEGAAEDNNLKTEYFSVYYIFVNLIFWIYKHRFTFHVSNSSP